MVIRAFTAVLDYPDIAPGVTNVLQNIYPWPPSADEFSFEKVKVSGAHPIHLRVFPSNALLRNETEPSLYYRGAQPAAGKAISGGP